MIQATAIKEGERMRAEHRNQVKGKVTGLREASLILGCTPRTVSNLIDRDVLKHKNLGTEKAPQYIFDESVLLDFLNKHPDFTLRLNRGRKPKQAL